MIHGKICMCEDCVVADLQEEIKELKHERDEAQEQYKKAVNRINMVLADGRRYERERDDALATVEQLGITGLQVEHERDEWKLAHDHHENEVITVCNERDEARDTVERIKTLLLSWQIVTRPEVDAAKAELKEALDGRNKT